MKIGQWLLSKKWITEDQLKVALKEQLRSRKRLGEVMIDLNFLSSEQLLQALSTLSDLPYIILKNQILDLCVVRQIPLEIAQKYHLIIFQQDSQGIHVAMADPEDLLALDKIRALLGDHSVLIPYHETLRGIAESIETYYPQPSAKVQDIEIVQVVNDLILEAVRLKASDIHFSPTSHHIDIRYRLDGLLVLAHTLHKEKWTSLSVRLKIMGSLDIAETRRPQNGRFSLTLAGRDIDFRLSCHPTIQGENLVIRILDKTQSLRTLDELGFPEKDVEILKHLVCLPQGMIILSGPTGTGKTTTLYALLRYINAVNRNIMTLEEPVEYNLPHIHQTEIREGGLFRFAEGVRSLLRQDPDVIFISEIRDLETAQMALRAAMTGHLVLATIHARNAAAIPQRFLDFGIDFALLKGNLVAGIAQRLIRLLCDTCRKPRTITAEEQERFILFSFPQNVYQATGCSFCREGYQGRQGICELVLFDDDLSVRQMEKHDQISAHNMMRDSEKLTLWTRGIQKVLEGKTTFAEIDRVIGTYH